MEWSDDGFVLALRPFGEGGQIVTVLTAGQGLQAGLVRGARRRAALFPGDRVRVRWRARLADQLGTLTSEPVDSPAARLLDDPDRLAALASACAVAATSLPERVPGPALFADFAALLQALDQGSGWREAYVCWELALLAGLGFGLDLSRCAATGANDDLAYVSPKSGRAVSLAAGEAYRSRLLALPRFLTGSVPAGIPRCAGAGEIAAGLALTGHFLTRCVYAEAGRPPPPARARLVARLCRD